MRVSGIHIIESLPGGFSRRTGFRLYETLESLAGGASPPRIEIHYRWVTTRQQLLDHLEAIAADAIARGRSPMLHFETHGAREGLQLVSGQVVTWKELQPALTAINVARRLNLIVIIAACNGLDLLKILVPTDRAPARLIIGPNRILTGS
jgi:hypothetical protein